MDVSIQALCPVCQTRVDQEGFGIPAWLLHKGEFYHTKCAPEFCTHEREYVADWKSIEGNDSVVYKYKCRGCGRVREEELIGAQLRAEGEQDEEDDGE